jgi:hypothetical protein
LYQVIDKHVSLSSLQVQVEVGSLLGQVNSSEGRDTLIGERLTAEKYVQGDKNVFARLLKLGVAEAEAKGRTVDLDNNEELPRLIPILQAYFTEEELVQLAGEKVATRMREMYRTELLQNLFLEHELQRVLRAFNEAEISLMLFKGPALAYTAYPKAHLRTYHDIDALIRPNDLSRAHELLIEMGFTFYEEFRSNVTNSKRTGYNYSLTHPDSWLEILIELHTAPHPSEIGTQFDVEPLWARARSITVLDEPTLIMDPSDHLLYLCWHYRFHAFSRLIWLYDLVVLLRIMGSELDWDTLVQKARHQYLTTTLYYCLSWCRDLFGVTIPAYVFAKLLPPLACRLVVERIAMPDAARALSVADCRARRVLAHRAMVDTTAGLAIAGMRALFPAPAALGRRYMSHSRLPLRLFFLFYLIHPWITLVKGVRYLSMIKRGRGKSS